VFIFCYNYIKVKFLRGDYLMENDILNLLLKMSSLGYLSLNKNLKIVDSNESYCNMLNYSKDELINLSITDIDNGFDINFLENLKGKEFFIYESNHRKKDGSRINLEISIFFNFDKNLINLFVIDKKHEINFQQLAENINIVFWIIQNNNFIYLNKYFEEIWGVSRENLYKNKGIFFEKIHPEDRKRVLSSIETFYKTGLFDEQYRIMKSEKSIKWIHSKNFPIYDKNKNLIKIIGFAEDITKRKFCENKILEYAQNIEITNLELNSSLLLLEKAIKVKNDFFSIITDEIKNPVNNLINYTEDALLSKSEFEIKSYLKKILNSSKRLLSTVTDIIDFSRIESKKMPLQKNIFSLNSFFNEIYNMFVFQTNEKGLTFLLTIDENIPEYVFEDYLKLKQIIINLINNAIKNTFKGHIELSIKKTFETDNKIKLKFSVSDTGIGLSMEKIENLNEYFSDPNIFNESKNHEIGLGLTICKKLLELMHSNLKVEINNESGCVFYFILETTSISQKERDTVNKSKLKKISNKNAHILIVEDNLLNQKITKDLLEKKEIKTTIANNGKEAVEFVEKNNYDLILMDIQMPIMNGYNAVEIIKNMKNKNMVPIIALTAGDSNEEKEKALNSGMVDYITKPFDPNEIIIKISKFIDFENKEDKKLNYKEIQGINYEKGLYQTGDNIELYNELLNYFLDSIDETLANINNFYKKNDSNNMREIIHTLKGTSGNMGMEKLHNLCIEYEKEIKEDKMKTKNYQFILDELKILKNSIKKYFDFQ